MKTGYKWLLLLIVALALAGCGAPTTPSETVAAAHAEPIEGSEFKRVILTEKAAERLGLETSPVRAEQLTRTRWVGGRVEAPPTDTTAATSGAASQVSNRIAVRLSEGELQRVDHTQPVVVQRLRADDDEDVDEGPDDDLPGMPDDDANGDDDDANEDGSRMLRYVVEDPSGTLVAGQPVIVKLTMSGGASERKIVDFASLIYGLHGETWVYTNPEPLVFVRAPVTVDFIEGDQAFLTEGPEVGTQVVTLGAAELYGVESGVGGGH
jgi:hypothetical protein